MQFVTPRHLERVLAKWLAPRSPTVEQSKNQPQTILLRNRSLDNDLKAQCLTVRIMWTTTSRCTERVLPDSALSVNVWLCFGVLRLTAFVLRSFTKAQSFIYIDPTKIEESKHWLDREQRENGCFKKSGRLFNNRMKVMVKKYIWMWIYAVPSITFVRWCRYSDDNIRVMVPLHRVVCRMKWPSVLTSPLPSWKWMRPLTWVECSFICGYVRRST